MNKLTKSSLLDALREILQNVACCTTMYCTIAKRLDHTGIKREKNMSPRSNQIILVPNSLGGANFKKSFCEIHAQTHSKKNKYILDDLPLLLMIILILAYLFNFMYQFFKTLR